MIRRSKRQKPKSVFYRTNERIFASSLRILDIQGRQIGVMSRDEALRRAREEGLDLVEIAPNAKPPVAKIIDAKKFVYQQEKKRREEKRKTKVSETKEVRLGPFMDSHDLHVMIKRAREFLASGNKVRLVVRFRGRQIVHPEFGIGVVDKVIEAVLDIAKVERERHFEGKQLIALLSPERKRHGKNEDQKVNSQTV